MADEENVVYVAEHLWKQPYCGLRGAKDAAQRRINQLAAESGIAPLTIEWGTEEGRFICPTEECQDALRSRFGYRAEIAISRARLEPITLSPCESGE